MRITSIPTPFPLPVRPEKLPRMAKVRVTYPRPRVTDIAREVRAQLDALGLPNLRGKRIAVTAGSRGIRDIVAVLAAAVAWLRERGAEPVVVAAMGSHGGATSEGQRSLLAHLGITEASVGAPIHSEMEVVELARTTDGLTVYCDRVSAACDAVLVVNRIKPHTGFAEPFGSGLMKMLAVGL
ncbi:MAG: lactate racemase domain-containing protein, partial [bacterium]